MANCLRTWTYSPDDSSCIGSLTAILVIEILVAIGSVVVILAVVWLWLRGRRAGSIDVATSAGERLGSSEVLTGEIFHSSAATSAPKKREFGDGETEMGDAASRTTKIENESTRTEKGDEKDGKGNQQQAEVEEEERKDKTTREKGQVELICRIGPDGIIYLPAVPKN